MSRVPGNLPPLDRGIFFVHISRARKHLAEERFDLARKELELADLAKPNDEEVLNLLSRSEEHTSELQSHLNLVCRLLLEKKKKKTRTTNKLTTSFTSSTRDNNVTRILS